MTCRYERPSARAFKRRRAIECSRLSDGTQTVTVRWPSCPVPLLVEGAAWGCPYREEHVTDTVSALAARGMRLADEYEVKSWVRSAEGAPDVERLKAYNERRFQELARAHVEGRSVERDLA